MQDNDGNTVLNMCFEQTTELDEERIKYLLQCKADANIQNNAGMNPLLRWSRRKGPNSFLHTLVGVGHMLDWLYNLVAGNVSS